MLNDHKEDYELDHEQPDRTERAEDADCTENAERDAERTENAEASDAADSASPERELPDGEESEPDEDFVNPWREPMYRTVPDERAPLYSPSVRQSGQYFGASPKKPKTPHRMGRGAVAVCIVLCILVSAAVSATATWAVVDRFYQSGSFRVNRQVVLGAAMPEEGTVPDDGGSETPADMMSGGDIYDQACMQVVGVTTSYTNVNIFGQQTSSAVSGTGFLISSDGYIMTNYHVIQYAAEYGYDLTVMLHDGTQYSAEIVGYYDYNDVAVIKIDAEGLTPVTFGDSEELSVGDRVYCVGNPLGELEFSMTSGIVSARDRFIAFSDGTSMVMFQIDAAVNSGNSGGPIYNAQGQVVGIVTAKYSSTGIEGLGFAIPINDAVEISEDLKEFGYVTGQAELGVTVRTVSESVAQYYHLHTGAYVQSVAKGSCAETAGIRESDIIIAVGDTAVASQEEYAAALRSCRAGDEVVITVFRSGGEEVELTVTLDEYVPAQQGAGRGQSGSVFGR